MSGFSRNPCKLTFFNNTESLSTNCILNYVIGLSFDTPFIQYNINVFHCKHTRSACQGRQALPATTNYPQVIAAGAGGADFAHIWIDFV